MKRRKQQTAMALFLCLALITVMILSAALVIHHSGHECIGPGCRVCDQLRHVGLLFRQFSLLAACFLAVAALFPRSFLSLREAATRVRVASPVGLKVRLNH